MADFAPARASQRKIKRSGENLQIELVPNPDIVAEVGEMPDDVRPFLIGFAAESNDLEANAAAKLRDKGLDLIVGNVVGGPFDAVGSDENKVTVFGAEGALDRLADASQAPGRRAAVGPDRRPIPTRPSAGRCGGAQRTTSPSLVIVVRRIDELHEAILERRVAGDSVGFVPTMGMLHDGQLSLVRRAGDENGCVVVSTFANPNAFTTLDEASPGQRDQARDLALVEHARAAIVFVPEVGTLYPPDDTTRVTVEGLTRQLEGASRPGHLDGLTTVMLKLIHLVGPARLYLGQRHAQQVVVVRRMLRDLFLNVELVICPTIREDDGLALSSANAQLGIEERHAAACLYNALTAAKEAYDGGERSAEVLRWRMTDVLSREPKARIDYVSVADASSLAELQRVTGPALALIAVGIGHTRLTDNMPLAWDVA